MNRSVTKFMLPALLAALIVTEFWGHKIVLGSSGDTILIS